MARSTTPTRRAAAVGMAGASSSSASAMFLPGRVSLVASAGARSSHQASNPPSVCLAAAASNHRRPAPPTRGGAKRACACSPTTHPGSFRCALHRGLAHQSAAASSVSSGLHARRSAMVNSLVRIAAVEGGDHVRRALAALIRPSSHHQRRRASFRPRPSRLSAMSTPPSTTQHQERLVAPQFCAARRDKF